MAENKNQLTQKLLELDQQLEFELRSFSDNVSALTETPERKQYDRFCGHLNYIQELLNDADQLTRDLPLDRNHPDFFSLLKTKGRIQEHAITFARLRGSFFKKYRIQEEKDQNLERILVPEEAQSAPEDPAFEEVPEEGSQEEDLLLQQQALAEADEAAEAEAAAKKQEKRKKAQRRMEEFQRRQRMEVQVAEDTERLKQTQAEQQLYSDEQESLSVTQPEEHTFSEQASPSYTLQQDTPSQDMPSKRLEVPLVEQSLPESSPAKHDSKQPSVAYPDVQSAQHVPQEGLQHQSETLQSSSSSHDRADQGAPDTVQRDRWEEANRLGIRYDPRKEISEAELFIERARQEEDVLFVEQAAAERRVHNAEVEDRFYQRQAEAEQHVRLGKGHIDFSHDLYGNEPDTAPSRETAPVDPAPTSDVKANDKSEPPRARQEIGPGFPAEHSEPPISSDGADAWQAHVSQHQQANHEQEKQFHSESQRDFKSQHSDPSATQPFHVLRDHDLIQQTQHTAVVPPLSPQTHEDPSQISVHRHQPGKESFTQAVKHVPPRPQEDQPFVPLKEDPSSVPNPASSMRREPFQPFINADHNRDEKHPSQIPLAHSEEKSTSTGDKRSGRPDPVVNNYQHDIKSGRPETQVPPHPDIPSTAQDIHRYRFERSTQVLPQRFKVQSGTFPSAQSVPTDSVKAETTRVYRSTPFGVREDPHLDLASHPSRSNTQIYRKIKQSLERSGDDKPVSISSAYLSSMAWNVHMARIDYQGKKDTPEALKAAQIYQRQRQSLEALKADVRAGRVLVEPPKTTEHTKTAHKEPNPKSPYPTQYHSTPFGVTGTNIGPDGQVTSSFRIHNKAVRDHFRYTADQPLMVSPKYEAAMQERLQKATSSLDTALKLKAKTPPKISSQLQDELRLSQDAYAAFKQAKQAGVVVVTDESKLDKPDFQKWQQRKQANIFGATVQHKAFDPTAPKKAEVEEHGASLLHKKSKLRNERFYHYYVQRIGQKTTASAYHASQILSRNLYLVLQSGEDNAVRTFENGRYYAVTAAQVASAVAHLRVVAPGRFERRASAQELQRFAKYLNKDNKTLSREIISKKQLAREGKQTIRSLKAQRDALAEKINGIQHRGAVLSAEDTFMLKKLGVQQRKVTEKLSSAQRAQFSLNHDLRREVAYLKLREQNADEARILNELKRKNGPFITRGKLQRDIKDTQMLAQKDLVKKYGKVITAYSDKSVKQEIKMLTKQGKALKSQIKALQAKGSSLTQAQRTVLKQLMEKHQTLSKRLRSLIGLDTDRAAINAELKLKHGLLMRMNQNANAFHSAMFAFKRFALRPLREGAESGVQGFSTGINVMTNRHVHRMLKKAFKASIRYAPGTVAFLATGDVHAATAAATYVERAAKMASFRTKAAAKRVVKKTSKLAAQGTKKAVSAITPQPVKRGVHYTSKVVRGKFRVVSAFKNKLQQKFWASKVGRGISAFREFGSNAMRFTKAAATLAKSVAVKVVAGFVLLFILCGVIASMAGAPAGGAAGGLILSPYEGGDGKIDLGPYMDILNDCQTTYDKRIEDTRTAYLKQYDKVTIVPAIPDNNSREILSMMAVRCSQDLDLNNAMVERYLKSIFEDSHFYTKQESEFYSCSGCKTKTVPANHSASCPENCTVEHTKKEKYCPGKHQDLTITLHVLFFDEIFTADSIGNQGQTAVAGQEIGTFKITHYCACSICCGKAPSDPAYGITATGTKVSEGRTIAVDPNVIPLGTHVVIDGVEYVAEDTGGAIKGNRIDIYINSHERAYELGVKYRPVYYASYEGESVVETGKWDGWTEDNVFWCKTIYNMDWAELYTGIPNVTDVVGNETNLDGVTFIDGDRAGNETIVSKAMEQLGQVGGQPFWSWYGFNGRVEWCATFVSWCANQSGALGTSVPKFASCRYEGVPWFQENGQWASADDIVPVAGDIIFFDWEGDGVPNHVGIVIGTDGDKVYTIEGNSNDAVRTKSYNLKSKLIFGYGLPNY